MYPLKDTETKESGCSWQKSSLTFGCARHKLMTHYIHTGTVRDRVVRQASRYDARTQFYYVDPLTSTFGRRQYLPHVMDYLPVRSITVCGKNNNNKKKLSHQCGPPLIGQTMTKRYRLSYVQWVRRHFIWGERGGSVVECRTPEREVRGSRATAAVLCP